MCRTRGCSKEATGPWGEYCSDCLEEKARREEKELRELQIAEMEQDLREEREKGREYKPEEKRAVRFPDKGV